MSMPRRETLFGMMLAAAMCPIWAGSNAGATLSVDLDGATPEIESSFNRNFQGAADTAFWVGIRVADARYLDSYEFSLVYDRSRMAFIRAASTMPGNGNGAFLESRGGSAPFFIGRLSAQDSGRITIANSLAGSDSSKAPGGSGLLAAVQFRPLAAGAARFALEGARLLDWNQDADAPASMREALLTLEFPSSLRGRPAALPMARRVRDRLELELGARTATLRIADMRGRELYRREGLSGRRTLTLPSGGMGGGMILLQSADGLVRLPFPAPAGM